MWPAREVELKLEVPAHSLYRLARSPLLQAARKRSPKPATLVSVYFDTDKLKLRNKGLTLRVRRTGRRHIQTIKQESGENSALFTRDEWEHQIGGRRPDLDVARDAALGLALDRKLNRHFLGKHAREFEKLSSFAPLELQFHLAKGRRLATRFDLSLVDGELDLAVSTLDWIDRAAHTRLEYRL